jgi:hypothetical protein
LETFNWSTRHSGARQLVDFILDQFDPGLMAWLGERAAEGLGHHSLIGVGAGILAKTAYDRLAASGLRTINNLIGAAYLHPEVAKILMQSIPPGGLHSPIFWKRLGAVLQRALIIGTMSNNAVSPPQANKAA